MEEANPLPETEPLVPQSLHVSAIFDLPLPPLKLPMRMSLGLKRVLVLMGCLIGFGLVLGGGAGEMAMGGLEVVGFVTVAVLAYLGRERRMARRAAIVCTVLLICCCALLSLRLGAAALYAVSPRPRTIPTPRLLLLGVAVYLGMVVSLAGFSRRVRVLIARRLPLKPDDFVHSVALVIVTAFTLIPAIPLLVLGHAPYLILLEYGFLNASHIGFTAQGQIYGLSWMIAACFLLVGWGLVRNGRETLARLGLVRPTGKQVLLGFGVGFGMVLLTAFGNALLHSLLHAFNQSATVDKETGKLFAGVATPFLALLLSIHAGVGEELAMRGVLQPRLGILRSNLMFTALHAFQYNLDGLLTVFLIGLLLSYLRRRTNTTTCAIAHATYDFILFLLMLTGGSS